MNNLTRTRDSWLVKPNLDKNDLPKIYCFAHAGGNAEDFLEWQGDMDDEAMLIGICPPGQGHRFSESRIDNVHELADSAAKAINQDHSGPFYLFGHSMGAILAYEVALRLNKTPIRLFLSGCAAPCFIPSERVVRISKLPKEEFIEEAKFFNGIPEGLEMDSEFQNLIFSRLKLDFEMIANYISSNKKLSAKITSIVGTSDLHVDIEKATSWSQYTSDDFEIKEASGSHFYFLDDPCFIPRLLLDELKNLNNVSASAFSELLI